MNTENWDISVGQSPAIRILRGQECVADPCSPLQKLAVQNFGSSSALPVSLLRKWYEKNRSIFRIAVTSKNNAAGYLSCLPLFTNMFNQTIDPDFQESSITAADIDSSFYPTSGGVFISAIVVAPEYQNRSTASLLLRLALIEDLIRKCPGDKQSLGISAQALSPKGESCMGSLGLKARGLTKSGWRIYFGKLGKTDLHRVYRELQYKIETRLKKLD